MSGTETSSMRPLALLLAMLIAQSPAARETAAAPTEVFEFDDFAVYVPADISAVRGVFLALGGPDTRAFITDGVFGAPVPETEASLHVLGQELRSLAAEHGLAMLGTSRSALADMPDNDELVFKAIGEAARISGHPELSRAPMFVYGMSGGTPQAAGFAARHPARVVALLLKVSGPPEPLSSAEALAVPSYVLLAEHDQYNDNSTAIAAIEFNRRAGGLWAVAVEPDVPHHSLTPEHRATTLSWLRTIVELRLGVSEQDRLQDVAEHSGWLGHPDIGVSSWADYPGDRRAAHWFPSQATAEEWWAFEGRGAIIRPHPGGATGQ